MAPMQDVYEVLCDQVVTTKLVLAHPTQRSSPVTGSGTKVVETTRTTAADPMEVY